MLVAGTKPKAMKEESLMGCSMNSGRRMNDSNRDIKSRQSMHKIPNGKTSTLHNSNIKKSNSLYNNMTQIVKRQYKAKLPNHDIQPAYARPTIATTARGVCIAKAMAAKTMSKAQNSTEHKSTIKESSRIKSVPPERLTAGQAVHSSKKDKPKSNANTNEVQVKDEVAIQTNEVEILNHDLVVGDVKLVMPSPALINAIEHARKERRKNADLSARRKYDAHDEKKSVHLSDLKEFLESATVKKRPSKRAAAVPKIQIKSNKG